MESSMESSVDPPEVALVVIETASLPDLTADNVLVIPDELLVNGSSSQSGTQPEDGGATPSLSVHNPPSLSSLAGEATISVMRIYVEEQNRRLREAEINPREPLLRSRFTLADILLDRPCHRHWRCDRKEKPAAGELHRSSSSPDILASLQPSTSQSSGLTTAASVTPSSVDPSTVTPPNAAPFNFATTSVPPSPYTRRKSLRPGIQSSTTSLGKRRLEGQTSSSSIGCQSTAQPMSTSLPPLEPNRRSRFVITYNYTQNRYRILRFTMETRQQPVFPRRTFLPRSLMNQIQGLGTAAVLTRRRGGIVERTAHLNSNVPRAVRRQQQRERRQREQLEHSGARGGRNIRSSSSHRLHQPQLPPVASTSRISLTNSASDLVTHTSLPTLLSVSPENTSSTSHSGTTSIPLDVSLSSINLAASPSSMSPPSSTPPPVSPPPSTPPPPSRDSSRPGSPPPSNPPPSSPSPQEPPN